jgi:thiamine-phosphate pyrophosphorylase
MHRRQTIPRQWLIADAGPGHDVLAAVRNLPRGSGVLVLFHEMPARDRHGLLRRLRRLAAGRSLTIVDEQPRSAARVHNLPELRRALLRETPLILLSPIYLTRSHSEWRPLRRMQAATLARLAGRRLIALGGMNESRFAQIRALGFQAWAGISAFRT